MPPNAALELADPGDQSGQPHREFLARVGGYQLSAAERGKLGHSDVDDALDDKALDASADGEC